jgi:DNA polymerase-1
LAIENEFGEVVGYKDEFADLLFKYRRVHKIQSSYILNLLEAMDKEQRVHYTAMVHGTETGRISIRNPALQTLPRDTTDRYGATVRSAVIAAPGYVLVMPDFSQAEMRVFACLTMDPFLLGVYRDGRDIHTEVTVGMFGEHWKKEHRMIVKRFNFGYIYGGGYAILHDSQIPEAEARKFMKSYQDNMQVAHKWREAQLDVLKAKGYVESPFGRRRRYPVITRANQLEAKHSGINMPVQSAASDLNQLAAIQLQREGFRVLLTIHDGMIIEVPTEDAQQAAVRIKDVMESTASQRFPQVPWKVDVDIADRWAEVPEFARSST